mmetsp:Transcript_15329/g.21337  ORF Transcript_15329/g.21337 Transcript_15329/m.21337 type:complete len:133 (-) Transcript_15329:328-726(-)
MEKIKSLFSDPKFTSEINGLIQNPNIFNNVKRAREILENTPEVRDQVYTLESQFRNLMESDLHFNEVITDVKKNGRAAISRVMKDEANLRLLWSKASGYGLLGEECRSRRNELPNADDLDKLSNMLSTMALS